MEWSGFYDAFLASVDSHKRLSNVQKFTHLRSCLSGRAYKCFEGYAVTNDNYPKALQDLRGCFGRKRLLVNELVKSILNLDVQVKADGKYLRHLYDTLQNRMTTPAYPRCCFRFLTRSYHATSKRNGSSSSRNVTMMKMTKRSISRDSFNSWRVTCSVKRLTMTRRAVHQKPENDLVERKFPGSRMTKIYFHASPTRILGLQESEVWILWEEP